MTRFYTHNNFAPASINAILDSCSKAKLVGLFWIGFNHCSTNIIENNGNDSLQEAGNSRTILVHELSSFFSLSFFAPKYGEGNDTKKMPQSATFLSRFVKIGSRSSHRGGQNRATDRHEVKIRLRRNNTSTVTDPSPDMHLNVFFVTAQAHFKSKIHLLSTIRRPCRNQSSGDN